MSCCTKDDDDWRALGGTQLCLKEHALPRADSVAPSIAAVAALVAKEAMSLNKTRAPIVRLSLEAAVVRGSRTKSQRMP